MWRSAVREGEKRKKSNTLTHQGEKAQWPTRGVGSFQKSFTLSPPSSFSFPPPPGGGSRTKRREEKGGEKWTHAIRPLLQGENTIPIERTEAEFSFFFFALGRNFYETKSTFIPRIHINMHSVEMRGELMGEVLLRLSFRFSFPFVREKW